MSFLSDLVKALLEHVHLTLLTLAVALLFALPLSLILARRPMLAELSMGVCSLLYTLPSLAMLAFMVILFGLGTVSAVIAMAIYAQLILLRHFVLGLQSIDKFTLEAAKAMGYTSWQRFTRVEFPLALPVWISGMRLAALSTVSIGVIAAWVNAGGLGTLIFEGLSQNHPSKIICASALIALLSLWIQGVLSGLESWAVERSTH